MINREIVKLLYEVADIFELKEVEWKPRAYRKAARKIEEMKEDISEVYAKEGKGGLEDLPGVGTKIADHIIEYIETGKVEKFEKLKKDAPAGISELINIRGLGPRKSKQLVEGLNIQSISDLKKGLAEHEVCELKGFGKRTEDNLEKAILQYEKSYERMLLGKAMNLAEEIISYLKESTDLKMIDYAGSLRRMKETIGDIDVLVVSGDSKMVMDKFVKFKDVRRVESRGKTRCTVILEEGVHIDLRVVPENSYGSALQYFTGSKDHNVALRNIALSKGYKLSEYGLFEKKSEKKVEGKKEERIYKRLGLSFIPPELRENRGELEAAKKDELPELVELKDIKGDLHIHTTYSDGPDDLETIVQRAKDLNYKYIAITDHSRSQKISGGLEIEEIKEQWDEITSICHKCGIKVLKGAEVNILPDGSLDYPEEVLKELDLVIGAIHSNFESPKKEMTERIVTALENKYMHVLGHPTGRQIGIREAYNVDLDTIFKKAATNNKMLEINCQPTRLDLNDTLIMQAKEYDVKFCINTDSHSSDQMEYMKYGVGQARRGWLKKKDVANTYSLKKFQKLAL
ncbi:DNA polymerase/3'-5' exonuclease PolX [Methanococcoides sp. NM1]|uniref:DNA polymerase/3'-5' exonuclease PolX n=1 Tax=Methanococcoides sp. NM1 TaxID=1201013 RepID=UPI001082FCF7|nr:DNA polymerase/3'-5' exonuclease PolX [Methanococcoides sp. NM1]